MGMTPKRELFAQGVASGLSQAEAYRQAGYSVANMKPETIWNDASMLMALPEVSARVAELQQAIEERAIMSAVAVRKKLSNIASAKTSDAVEWDEQGVWVKPSKSLSPETLDAVASVKVKRRRVWVGSGENAEPWEVEEIELKMHDPIAAARELSKLRGDYPKGDAPEVNVNVNVDQTTQLLQMFGSKEELIRAAREVSDAD